MTKVVIIVVTNVCVCCCSALDSGNLTSSDDSELGEALHRPLICQTEEEICIIDDDESANSLPQAVLLSARLRALSS